MATLNIPNSFTAGTAAVASQVNSNFTAVKTFVEAIAAGTNIDSGAVTAAKLASDVSNLFVPVGGVLPYAGSSAPAGGKWMLADGSAISRTSYSVLFAAIGTTYGAGDTVTTFNLPNLKGRVVVGFDATQTEFDALAETGGAKTHTLSAAESGMPAHGHGVTDTGHYHTTTLYTADLPVFNLADANVPIYETATINTAHTKNTDTKTTGVTVNSASASAASSAHNNLQPYVVLNYLIRVV
jgi:microcystin-dependent protein